MVIPRAMLEELVAHAREEAPNECCGVLASEPGTPTHAARLYRTRNVKASPLSFEVDGLELLGVNTEIEEAGCELGAIYHSHTRTAPYPSQTDINFAANWPGVEWIIVGLAGERPEVRSYLIEGGLVSEVEVVVGEPAT